METIKKDLKEIRKVTDSTANAYVRYLKQANGNKDFDTMLFLKDTEKVFNNISKYRDSTKKAILGGIVSILQMYKAKIAFKKCFPVYFEKMMELSKKSREEDGKNEMTEKQKQNWTEWADVIKKRDELNEKVSKIDKKKSLSATEWNELTEFMILSLFTDIAPRRNADYMLCRVVKKMNDDLSKEFNYLDLSTNEFIFNRYKTAKTYSTQREKIPEVLRDKIMMYLKHHPIFKDKTKQKEPIPFLVFYDGKPFTAVNSITRVLNKIFGKAIGSSMLRHIYISGKYGKLMDEMKKDSEAMGHSIEEQRAYYKKDDTKNDIITHE
jgi:hypothetical protein